MYRFQAERALMAKRWRQEWVKHGRDFGACHCAAGMGTMRKHRPYESHPSSSCWFCAWVRLAAKKARRQARYEGRRIIATELGIWDSLDRGVAKWVKASQ